MTADIDSEKLTKIDLDWTNIETVFLDMDGTLLDLHFDNYFWLEHLPNHLALTRQQSRKEVESALYQHMQDTRGTLDWYCLDYWQDYLGIDVVSLKHEVANRIAIKAHVEDFFEHLHSMGKRVILLTNAHHKTIALKFGYVDLERNFDRVISSHSIGYAKEDKQFWEQLVTVEPINKEKCLFIDDNLEVLRAAKKYGVGYLLSIHQPDSKRQPQDTQEFIALQCYQQLMG